MDEEVDHKWRALSEEILTDLKAWRQAHPKATFREIEQAVQERTTQLMQYPAYQQAGWPIGSGMVEYVNKLVMQTRLKGPLPPQTGCKKLTRIHIWDYTSGRVDIE